MSSRLSNDRIKAEAHNLGFLACGIAKAAPVEAEDALRLTQWIDAKGHAGMEYMDANTDKRLNPLLLMDGVKSIVCVALNYAPARRIPETEPQIAAYALGRDYHYIMKDRLHALAAALGITNYRAFCDTAPVLERYWAMKAGLGWIGRNRQLIVPNAGSMVFLGELFVDTELEYDSPLPSRCGNCHACTDACPTGALQLTGKGKDTEFRSGRCLSYLTIENRGNIPDVQACKMGNCIYGCDRCQEACPWNRFAQGTTEKLLMPREDLLQMTREKWAALTVDDYRRLFKGSAVKRAKYDGLMRNIKAALRNNDNINDEII